MEGNKKQYELTTKGKIILGVAALLLVGIIIFIFIPKGGAIERISIEMVAPNEGIVIEDPILGMSTELEVGKKIKLASTIYPTKHRKEKVEYVSENPEIAEVNDENMIVGKSAGTTKIYMRTTGNNEIKSNTIEVTIVD